MAGSGSSTTNPRTHPSAGPVTGTGRLKARLSLTLTASAVLILTLACLGRAATVPPISWSGDGRRVVLADRLSEGYGVYIFDTEGRRSSFIPFSYPVVAIKWPVSDRPIVLLARHTNGKYYLWTANPFGIIRRISARPVYVHPGPSANFFAVSPDCEQAAFASSTGGNVDIWKVGIDLGADQRLTDSRGKDFDPVWSPDGRWIAFTSDRGGTLGIWLMSSGGRPVRKLVDGPGREQHATWSPDSQRIAFLSSGSEPGIYAVGLSGGALRPIAVGGRNYFAPIWSSTGKWLAFSYGSNPTNIFTTPIGKAQGRGPYYQISFDRGNSVVTSLRSAAWSPGKDQLAFCTYEDGRLSIQIASLSEKLGPVLKNIYSAPAVRIKRD